MVLTGVDASALHSGCVVCHPEFPVRLAVKFIAQVLVLDVGMPFLKGHAVTVHTHSAREAGVISHLVALCDGKTGAVTKQRPRCLIGGQVKRAGCSGRCLFCRRVVLGRLTAGVQRGCGNRAVVCRVLKHVCGWLRAQAQQDLTTCVGCAAGKPERDVQHVCAAILRIHPKPLPPSAVSVLCRPPWLRSLLCGRCLWRCSQTSRHWEGWRSGREAGQWLLALSHKYKSDIFYQVHSYLLQSWK